MDIVFFSWLTEEYEPLYCRGTCFQKGILNVIQKKKTELVTVEKEENL